MLNLRHTTAALAALCLLACGDDGSDPATDVSPDTADATDVETDAADTTVADATDADAIEDADDAEELDTADADTTPLDQCEAVALPDPDPVDTEQSRFALTMFHYNVEYVIGGLEYFDEERGELVRFLGLPLNIGWDHEAVEDYIVRETLMPMLEMYDRHPTWRATFEMQAYAIELMADRHPDILLLLRKLAQRGQIELVSFHYAAQLFLAFPREEQLRSLERTREVFERYCLPLSSVVFNQEGQAGEGRQRMLVEEGWRIGVQPKNLWRYVRDGETPWPYYASEGGVLIVGPGGVDPESGVEVTWPFFDDGELRAVAEAMNPYTAPIAPHSPERVAEYEAELQALEDEGWKHTTITDYVHQLEGRELEMPAAPPLLDGTWQPPSTDSIHRWLGGRSQANVGDEEDNRVRSGNAVARMHADATQVLVDAARALGQDTTAWDAELRIMWDDVFRSQISDGSGVNPWRAEVLWCLDRNEDVLARAETVRNEVLAALGWDHVAVDLLERTAVDIEGPPIAEPPDEIEAPLTIDIRADGRTVNVTWYETPAPGVARLEVSFGASQGCEDCDDRRLVVGFPRTEDVIRYSPGLIEDEVRSYDESEFSFLLGEVYLPLANGLIGLGDDLWVIKHTRQVHIAARYAPDDDHIRFVDAALWRDKPATWVFDVIEGTPEEALAWATRLNIDPIVYY